MVEQARSLPTDKLRIVYIAINGVVYLVQVSVSYLAANTNIYLSLFALICLLILFWVVIVDYS
jgi:hypothetical protein